MRALLILASLGGGSIADAKAPPVPLAIGGVEVTGAKSDAVEVAVVDAVRTGLGKANPGPKSPAVGACITPACLSDAARAAGADHVVAVAVAVTGGEQDQYKITVVIADHDGRALRRRAADCATCSVAEATDHVTALVAEAVTALTDDAVAVEIVTAPIPAPIAVDGVDRGRAPWSGSLPAGPHHVVAGTIDQEFFLEATGQPQRIDVALPLAPDHRRRFGPLITYGTAGAGVGALILGSVLLAKDGDQTCDHPSCPEVHDTATGGWIGVGFGVVALGAAGYMFWHDREASRPVIAVVPTEGGAAAVAAGRF